MLKMHMTAVLERPVEFDPETETMAEQVEPRLMAIPENASVIRLPGLIDMHVHLRDPGAPDKETFESGTKAAIAGGIVAVYDMPNNPSKDLNNPYQNRTDTFENTCWKRTLAKGKAFSDLGIYGEYNPAAAQARLEFCEQNSLFIPKNRFSDLGYMAALVSAWKFYIEITQGNDQVQSVETFRAAAEYIHQISPKKVIAAHVEDESAEDAIGMIAQDLEHPFHIPHANNRYLLELAIKAKKEELDVTVGVCPHHLFLTEDDVPKLGWRGRMKPPLASQEDQDFLWNHLDDIDIFETDHAPHTIEEKDKADQENPEGNPDGTTSYGVPGLEAMLPLLLQAIEDKKLTREQLIEKTSTNPAKRMGYKVDPKTEVTVMMQKYEFSEADVRSKCGWSPYVGKMVTGRVIQVDLHGQTVYSGGQFTTKKGQGQILSNNETV